METRKLELKDIAGYLPYGLWCCYDTEDMSVEELGGVSPEHWLDKFGSVIDCIDEEIKPILRPISDLYKTITHNGKEIIPIVELAKTVISTVDWKIEKTDCTEVTTCRCKSFMFDLIGNGFHLYNGKTPLGISNQYQLFDYLHELKIDYRGLIDAGLAISVYDFDINPYK